MKIDIKLPGGGVIIFEEDNSQIRERELISILTCLPAFELVCLRDSINASGNIVGGLICMRNVQMFPQDDSLIAEAVPPITFELTRYPDEFPDFYCLPKKDNRDRNKFWKESLRKAEQKNSKRSRRS